MTGPSAKLRGDSCESCEFWHVWWRFVDEVAPGDERDGVFRFGAQGCFYIGLVSPAGVGAGRADFLGRLHDYSTGSIFVSFERPSAARCSRRDPQLRSATPAPPTTLSSLFVGEVPHQN